MALIYVCYDATKSTKSAVNRYLKSVLTTFIPPNTASYIYTYLGAHGRGIYIGIYMILL